MSTVPPKRRRRLVLASLLAVGASGLFACAHEERRPISVVRETVDRTPAPARHQAQYVVADSASKGSSLVVALGGHGQNGLIVDRRRLIVGAGEPRVASEAAPESIIGVKRVPSRLGGGFLFWTSSSIYRSESFDGPLIAVAHTPDPLEAVSFAPKAILARTRNGERWGFTLPRGDRAAVLPVGIADIEALDDGRALGFTDQGSVYTSVDHGAHFTDATALVKSSPVKVTITGEDLWVHDVNGGASRLEPDGRLSWFDKPPPDPPPQIRPKDPRWHGAESPLRSIFHTGALIDDATAVVIEGGDLVRVDGRTGEILSVMSGRLPPDATCEAIPTQGDTLFACMSRAGSSSFIVSHTRAGEPLIEQTFMAGGGFFTSDDGGVVYTSPCAPSSSPTTNASVCVRLPGGRWEDRDLSGLSLDGGGADISVARWVPRADGHVVALVLDPTPGIYDPTSQTLQPISDEAKEALGRGVVGVTPHLRTKVVRRISGSFVDGSWSFGDAGTLRGWQRHGESVEISEDGKLTKSPYTFDLVSAGAFGLGRSKDGRLYQSTDHGVTWAEVATPPSGIEAADLVSCTTAGCDLGAFFRVGWAVRPPRFDPPAKQAALAPEIRRVRGLELSCRPDGPPSVRSLPRTDTSPDDLGLGATRLQVASEKSDWAFVRNTVAPTLVTPVHDAPMSGDDSSTPSFRAMFTGFATSRDSDVITVMGPNKSAMSLRRAVSYVPVFDPAGRVVRSGINMSDVVAAGRRAGMTTDEILAEDFTETGTVIPLSTLDPAAPSDIVVHNSDHGLLSIVRADRTRVTVRPSQNGASLVSAAALSNDEVVLLEVESSGVSHVFKVGASGAITDLFELNPPANEAYYPANPDAVAVGSKGDVAILRIPSGSDPPSALDPAYLIAPAKAPVALAPWSSLKLANDPSCTKDKEGYRAVVQSIAPWIRTSTPELRVDESPMFARVRWSETRLCLEGFEVRLPAITLPIAIRMEGSSATEPGTFATWLVSRNGVFARVSISEGLEWRQPLACSTVGTGP